MRLSSILSVFAFLCFSCALFSADGPKTAKKAIRHIEQTGGYSFVPPPGWTMGDLPAVKYKAALGPVADDITPSMVFLDEAFRGKLADYVVASKKELAKAYKDWKMLAERKLKTDAGVDCIVMVIQRGENGQQLRQTLYFLQPSSNKVLLVICSAKAEGGKKFDPAFDASIKTLRVETKKPVRHVEKAGGYSFVPPPGWTMGDLPTVKYKAALGPVAGGVAPSIVFVDEAFKGNLAGCVAAGKKGMAKVYKDFKVLEEKKLKTDAGVESIVLVTQRGENARQLRQIMYFLEPAPGKMLTVICTALADGGKKLDPLFETSIKTLRVEAKKPVRHVEKSGGYSFVPPAGWNLVKNSSNGFQAAVGPSANGFKPNFNFQVLAFDGSKADSKNLAETVSAAAREFAKTFKNYKKIAQKNLKTEAGADGVVLVCQREINGRELRHNVYVFEISADKMLMATCTALAEGGDKLDPIFEASLKTLRLEKP